MIINDDFRYIFFHINKNGGGSISKALGYGTDPKIKIFSKDPHWQQHATYMMVKEKFPKKLSYFTFTFVRNPWDRMVSMFFWNVRRKLLQAPLEEEKKHFEECLRNPTKYIKKRSLVSQYDRIRDEDGKIKIDFIGRFESLLDDFEIICSKLGISNKMLDRIHPTIRRDYRVYYKDETIEIVRTMFYDDIERFGYIF